MDDALKNIHIQSFKLPLLVKPGSISVEIYEPERIQAVLIIGHGAGTNMHHAFLKSLATCLTNEGVATVRFNFPYTEQGKKMPDRFPIASTAIREVLKAVYARYPNVPIFAGGKSFGGRMCSQTLAETPLPFVKGVVFFGFPLHPANQPSVQRAEHLKHVQSPMLFLQGTKDTLADNVLIHQVCEAISNAKLISIEDADHSFKKGKQSGITLLCSHTVGWINSLR